MEDRLRAIPDTHEIGDEVIIPNTETTGRIVGFTIGVPTEDDPWAGACWVIETLLDNDRLAHLFVGAAENLYPAQRLHGEFCGWCGQPEGHDTDRCRDWYRSTGRPMTAADHEAAGALDYCARCSAPDPTIPAADGLICCTCADGGT